MKILLFGEFSGLHKHLKSGLTKLGHEVVIAAGKDSFKDIESDINLDPVYNGLLGMLERRLKPFIKISKLTNFDVVQTINPFFPNAKIFPKLAMYMMLKALNKKFFMLAAGSDAYYWKYSKENLRYGPFDDFLKYDVKSSSFYMQTKKAYKYNSKILDIIDGVIPIMYEYELAYSDSPKKLNTIPLPVDLSEIEYSENLVGDKIVVFHGLSRYGFKGTKYIEEAFAVLKERYPNDLELIIEGQMPLKKYLKVMKKTNIIIDQTSTYSLGMNGVFALAMGKIVLGGGEQEGLDSLGIENTPVVNILPKKESIITAIESIIEKKHEITDMGRKSREFVEKHHCAIKVAKKYVETWNNANLLDS